MTASDAGEDRISGLANLRRLRLAGSRRAKLARVPERPVGIARLAELLERSRASGVVVEELDELHVRLRYDARVREQWLAIDDLYQAARASALIEGEDQVELAPGNWMAVHLDLGSCGESLAP